MSRRCNYLCLVMASALLAFPNAIDARIVPNLNYQLQFNNSDLVVIATPLNATKDTNEHSVFPGISLLDLENKERPAESIGVETKFRVSLVLKGNVGLTDFTLHHYREPGTIPTSNGPLLVSFSLKGATTSHSFLMFLEREDDGRYAPTGGQVDPAMIAVFPLPTGAP